MQTYMLVNFRKNYSISDLEQGQIFKFHSESFPVLLQESPISDFEKVKIMWPNLENFVINTLLNTLVQATVEIKDKGILCVFIIFPKVYEHICINLVSTFCDFIVHQVSRLYTFYFIPKKKRFNQNFKRRLSHRQALGVRTQFLKLILNDIFNEYVTLHWLRN